MEYPFNQTHPLSPCLPLSLSVSLQSCLCCWCYSGSLSNSMLPLHHGTSLQYKHTDHWEKDKQSSNLHVPAATNHSGGQNIRPPHWGTREITATLNLWTWVQFLNFTCAHSTVLSIRFCCSLFYFYLLDTMRMKVCGDTLLFCFLFFICHYMLETWRNRKFNH